MAFDFPNAPTVGQVFSGYVWDGEKWLTQPAKGSKKNYILNGAMMVSQENGGNSVGYGFYPVDCFAAAAGGTSGVSVFAQQSTTIGAGQASPNRLRAQVTTADVTVGAGDIVYLNTRIEGLRVADLKIGTAFAKTVTLQFTVSAPAGTYCVSFHNSGSTRGYVAEYVIAAGEANTPTVKSVTLTLDTAGAWLVDNNIGLEIDWMLMAGATYQVAANTWMATANTAYATANQFNFMGAVNNVFDLTDVSLTEGTIAPPFQVPDYASELALCKRDWNKIGGAGPELYIAGYTSAGIGIVQTLPYPVAMRGAPTATLVGAWTVVNVGGILVSGVGTRAFALQLTSIAAGFLSAYTPNDTTYVSLNARL